MPPMAPGLLLARSVMSALVQTKIDKMSDEFGLVIRTCNAIIVT